MMQPTIDPSDETIRLGPLVVRFLITGKDSNGSVAIFELGVPRAQRLEAPAHSHEHYEETVHGSEGVLTWTIDVKGPPRNNLYIRPAARPFARLRCDDVIPWRALRDSMSVRERPSASRAAPFTDSTTMGRRT